MNATNTAYNPFRASAAAAFAELSSEQAKRFYFLKAQEDIQTVLDASVTVFTWVYQLAELTYLMGTQCRAWCDALETNAQAPAQPVLLAPARIGDTEDPWEVEADYKLVEFSSSVAAQATTSPMLMLSPASAVICGPVWNPAPKDMHTEVERMTRVAAPAVDELVSALEVPGATGDRQRKPRAKAGSKTAAKPKKESARAKARAGAK